MHQGHIDTLKQNTYVSTIEFLPQLRNSLIYLDTMDNWSNWACISDNCLQWYLVCIHHIYCQWILLCKCKCLWHYILKWLNHQGYNCTLKRKNYYNYETLYKFHICCLLCVPDWPIFKQIMTTSAKSIEKTVRKIRTLKIFWKLTFMFSPLLGNWQVTKAWPDSDCFWSTDYYL